MSDDLLQILIDTSENIEKLIQCAATVRLMAACLEKIGMTQSAKILRDVFEDIMRVAASLKSQQTGETEEIDAKDVDAICAPRAVWTRD